MNTTLNVRGLPVDVKRQIERAAKSRGLSYADYLEKLADLHVEARRLAERGCGPGDLAAILHSLGLDTVTA